MGLERRQLVAAFQQRMHCPPRFVVRAPGRVNLIGEHTDYNDGFVLPLAIDRAVWIALVARATTGASSSTRSTSASRPSSPSNPCQHDKAGWIEYLKGTAWSLQDDGLRLQAGKASFRATCPSAPVCRRRPPWRWPPPGPSPPSATSTWNPAEMAKLGQRAENRWVGVNCGIMDQLISAAGRAGHALLIDCRSLDTQPVPFPPGMAVVVLDTATRRGLVDSAYNERRAQCEAAAKFFGVTALRDVDLGAVPRRGGGLDPTTRRRARHVITENQRTHRGRRGDAPRRRRRRWAC